MHNPTRDLAFTLFYGVLWVIAVLMSLETELHLGLRIAGVCFVIMLSLHIVALLRGETF